MSLMDGIGRNQILIGAGVLVALVVISVPLVRSMNRSGARAEVGVLVESIRQAELVQGESFQAEGYISAGWAPRQPTALSADTVQWQGNQGFTSLGWSPVKEGYEWVRGTYKVAATRDGFTVTGKCDIDGDGVPAVWEATQDSPATQITDPSVY